MPEIFVAKKIYTIYIANKQFFPFLNFQEHKEFECKIKSCWLSAFLTPFNKDCLLTFVYQYRLNLSLADIHFDDEKNSEV